VEIDLNMLRPLVLNEIGGEVDDADIVAVDESGLRQWSVELLKWMPEPACFATCIGHDPILSLSAQVGNNVMILRRSGDEVVAEEHSVA
jgi:hypothetical protein